MYPWFSPEPLPAEPEVSFCMTWGSLFFHVFKPKMFPYGRIFLKVSNVVNSLQHCCMDSWLFYYGSHMKEFSFLWFLIITSLLGISYKAMQRVLYDRAGTRPLMSIQGTPTTCLYENQAMKGDQEPWRRLADRRAEEKDPPEYSYSNKTKTTKSSKSKTDQAAYDGEEPGQGYV